MEFINFKNSGTLEPEFIKSFGVSVKSDQSCIGFFGTGLKYAIAIFEQIVRLVDVSNTMAKSKYSEAA